MLSVATNITFKQALSFGGAAVRSTCFQADETGFYKTTIALLLN